jgi:hypothetical protein
VERTHQKARFADILRTTDLSASGGLSFVWGSRCLGSSLGAASETLVSEQLAHSIKRSTTFNFSFYLPVVNNAHLQE